VVRASGVFNSISDFSVAVVALTRESCELKAIRMKDRVTYPLANGYRDVLVNFLMEGCDLILELQLHFEDIIAIKKESHKFYVLLRAAGWDGDEVEDVEVGESTARMFDRVGPAALGVSSMNIIASPNIQLSPTANVPTKPPPSTS